MINIHMKGHSVDRVDIDGVPVQSCVHEYGRRGGCRVYTKTAGIHTVAVPFSLEFMHKINKNYEESGYAPPFDMENVLACSTRMAADIVSRSTTSVALKHRRPHDA